MLKYHPDVPKLLPWRHVFCCGLSADFSNEAFRLVRKLEWCSYYVVGKQFDDAFSHYDILHECDGRANETRVAVDMKFHIHIHIHIHRFSVDIHGYPYPWISMDIHILRHIHYIGYMYRDDWNRGSGQRGTVKKAGVDNAGVDNVARSSKSGQRGSGQRGTK